MNLVSETIEQVRASIAAAGSVAVLTGAGISADSGIPTFRGEGGLWKQYRAEELATPEAFRRDPKTVWEWYQWRRQLLSTKKPNAAHDALAAFEEKRAAFTLITQNVDGFHALAGSRNVIELHGNIWKTRCTGCLRITENRSLELPSLPLCDLCHTLVRPHIVWFGEGIDPVDLEKSISACRDADVLLVIGTSGMVQPAASFASLAKAGGVCVVEINIEPALSFTPDATLRGRASEIVPRLLVG